jgi:hypothetical protein
MSEVGSSLLPTSVKIKDSLSQNSYCFLVNQLYFAGLISVRMNRIPASVHASLSRVHAFTNIVIVAMIDLFLQACSSQPASVKEEQIRIQDVSGDSVITDTIPSNSIQGNLSLSQVITVPNHVVLTGLAQHRLVTVYKSYSPARTTGYASVSEYGRSVYHEFGESEYAEHFMPGIDLIYGYNLLNIAHYDIHSEKLNYLFENPVLVKSLYFPSFIQDSLNKKPINRDYYLVSVYDSDTNLDTLINKRDLRRIYYFNADGVEKVQLVPPDHSVIRSEYDPQNDIIYIFARQDVNHNGMIEKKEPLHIFWTSLKTPAKALRLY